MPDFDSNQFDEAIKKAKKLNEILKNSNELASLRGIETAIASFSNAGNQLDRIIARVSTLKAITENLAKQQAKISDSVLERVTFYDKELISIERNKKKLSELLEIAKQGGDSGPLSHVDSVLNDLRNQLKNGLQLQEQLGAELDLRNTASEGKDYRILQLSTEYLNTKKLTDALETKITETEQKKLNLIKEQRDTVQSLTKQMQEQEEIAKNLIELKKVDAALLQKQQSAKFKQFVLNKVGLGGLFGGGVGGGLGGAGGVGGSLGGMGLRLGIIGGLISALVLVLKSYQKALKTAIDRGLDPIQRGAEVGRAGRLQSELFRSTGANASVDQLLTSAQELAGVFGTLKLPDELIKRGAFLNRTLGITNKEFATLSDLFVRIRGETADQVIKSTAILRSVAVSNTVNPAEIMRDVAHNADNFSKSSKAGSDSLARAAILARRMGVDLSRISDIADRIVTDFEGTLKAQANIAAFAPGFDMSGLLVASQFGTDEDIQKELSASVKSLGLEFDQIPRSIKSSIAGSLGLSVSELGRLSKLGASGLDLQATIQGDVSGIRNELHNAIANPLDTIARTIVSIFNMLTSSIFFKAPREQTQVGTKSIDKPFTETETHDRVANRSTMAKVLGELGIWGPSSAQIRLQDESERIRYENLVKKQKKANQSIDSELELRDRGGRAGIDPSETLSLSSALDRISPMAIPTILHKGEAVLNNAQMRILTQSSNVKAGMDTAIGQFLGVAKSLVSAKSPKNPSIPDTYIQDIIRSQRPDNERIISKISETKTRDDVVGQLGKADMSGVEAKLDTLITLLQNGAITVNMDGKKVSDILITANRYS